MNVNKKANLVEACYVCYRYGVSGGVEPDCKKCGIREKLEEDLLEETLNVRCKQTGMPEAFDKEWIERRKQQIRGV